MKYDSLVKIIITINLSSVLGEDKEIISDMDRRFKNNMVSVRVDNIHHCDGTIIADFWILTVKACLISEKHLYPTRMITTYRSNKINLRQNVKQTGEIVHTCAKLYPYDDPLNDDPPLIGLIKLNEPYDNFRVNPLHRHVDDKIRYHGCTIMGWYRTGKKDPVFQLAEAKAERCYKDSDTNDPYEKLLEGESKHIMICWEKDRRKHMMIDYGGSPLVYLEFIYGIYNPFFYLTEPVVTTTHSHHRNRNAMAYIKLEDHRWWIKNTLSKARTVNASFSFYNFVVILLIVVIFIF